MSSSRATRGSTLIGAADTGSPPPSDVLVRRVVRDVVVLAPAGVLDRRSLRELDRALADDEAPAALDLTSCTLVERAALEQLDPRRWARTSSGVCVVCNRLIGRQLLARAGVSARLSVFHRIEDAVQSRVLAAAGFGTGWNHVTM